MSQPTLRRVVTLPFLIFYGVGTMVGCGFYALMGKVVGIAGMAAPIAFGFCGLLALLTALSFAELSSRFPVSMGSARYMYEGFASIRLSTVTGWLVILSGVVSAAALAVASVGFLGDMWTIDPVLAIIIIVAAMVAVAAWGIGPSIAVVSLITTIEVAALLYVFGANLDGLSHLPERWPELLALDSPFEFGWIGVLAGAFLAFYAMIGFEDMVTLAEEVKSVRHTLPIAIVVSILLTTLLYIMVSLVAVLSLDLDTLAFSATPMAELVREQGHIASIALWSVSLMTGINGALVQLVMAARVAYGMAQRNQAPGWLGSISPHTRTPVHATLGIGAVTLALALLFPLTTLAKITSAILLLVFAGVNLALWRIKRANPDVAGAGPRYPRWVPMTGFAVSLLVLLFQGWYELG